MKLVEGLKTKKIPVNVDQIRWPCKSNAVRLGKVTIYGEHDEKVLVGISGTSVEVTRTLKFLNLFKVTALCWQIIFFQSDRAISRQN